MYKKHGLEEEAHIASTKGGAGGCWCGEGQRTGDFFPLCRCAESAEKAEDGPEASGPYGCEWKWIPPHLLL